MRDAIKGGNASPFTWRLAVEPDVPLLHAVMNRSIASLQSEFLDPAQVAASYKVMGLDSQLVRDGTYFVVEEDLGRMTRIAGCGGWSYRATLYGGDASIVDREPGRLDPARDAAKVRAMYTDPDFVRRGVGRLIIRLCEDAARTAGFQRVELMATAAGVSLYRACGYVPLDAGEEADVGGVRVPLLRMGKQLI